VRDLVDGFSRSRYDIHTVGHAVESASSLGVEMQTIHLSGGRAMIEAAVLAAPPETLLLGVTVLTSVDQAALHETGIDSPMEKQVLRLAQLGVDSGIGGVVASPLEIAPLRHVHGSKLRIVTPGIRLRDAALNDQKRTLTPAEASAPAPISWSSAARSPPRPTARGARANRGRCYLRALIYEDRAPVSAAMNMAIDEALLEHCPPGFALLRLARPSLSLRLLRQICRYRP
jgi:hypothetical protein